jgi:phosphoribosyl 1,2-cyclic phosphodiesterase
LLLVAINVSEISLRFWGVRGSIPCPDAAVARYGGNTACVEVRCGERLVIFDGGSGLRLLGNELVKSQRSVDADILYSHCHLDHICGLPFFAPIDMPTANLRLWAGNLLPNFNLEQVLRRVFGEPLFPNSAFDNFACSLEFNDFRAGDTLNPNPEILIHSAPLIHPGGATGYRLEYRGRVIAYVTDTEHRPGHIDQNVLRLAQNADLLIYDCTYTQEEFSIFVGRGHSTWCEGVRLAEAAAVKTLAIFHHDPAHDDAFMDCIATEAASARPGTFVAIEGATIQI